MRAPIGQVGIYKTCNLRCCSCHVSLSCGKTRFISTMKSPLNSSGNPQSILGRLCHSDGSKSPLAEWWQLRKQWDELLEIQKADLCLGIMKNGTSKVSRSDSCLLWAGSVTTISRISKEWKAQHSYG